MPQPASHSPTVFVVDDDPAVLQAVSRLLRSWEYDVRTYLSADALLEQYTPEMPGCFVVDVTMPGLNGLDLQAALAGSGNARSIIFITGHGDIPTSVRAMKAGAVDFLMKPFAEEDLIAAVRVGLEKDRTARAAHAERAALHLRLATLTKRERQVLQGVVAGRLNKQIAAELHVAEKTIKVHRHRVMEKMHTASLAELVRLVERAKAQAADA
jgi:FixJ family two-component response regulator